jgi:hypothetical protein
MKLMAEVMITQEVVYAKVLLDILYYLSYTWYTWRLGEYTNPVLYLYMCRIGHNRSY